MSSLRMMRFDVIFEHYNKPGELLLFPIQSLTRKLTV